MKLRFALIMSLTLACGSPPKDEDPSGDSRDASAPVEDSDRGSSSGRHPCDRRQKQTIRFDGGTWVIDVPSLCDPTPTVDRGDPPWNVKENSHAR